MKNITIKVNGESLEVNKKLRLLALQAMATGCMISYNLESPDDIDVYDQAEVNSLYKRFKRSLNMPVKQEFIDTIRMLNTMSNHLSLN